MELIAALKSLQVGDEVELLSTDKGSVQEVADWCEEVKQDCISMDEKDGDWSVVVRKAK
jgi:TusA-related sulfurtransferase